MIAHKFYCEAVFVWLVLMHAHAKTRARAFIRAIKSGRRERRGHNGLYASRLAVPLNKSFVRRESANY